MLHNLKGSGQQKWAQFILIQLPDGPGRQWVNTRWCILARGPCGAVVRVYFPSLEPVIKFADTVQARPHDELKRTLGELWPGRGGHAVCNHHLVLTQGMVKLKKKKKAKMYERD